MPKRTADLDPAKLLASVRCGPPIKYRKNAKIFRQGEAADAVFYIVSGQIKLTVTSAQGRDAVIAVLDKGTFFGEGCLAAQPLRIATATSYSESEVQRVPRDTLARMLVEMPQVAEMFFRHLLTRAIRVEADLIDQMFNSSEKRLARALLLLANVGKETKAEPILGTISQDALADMIGTTRSRVSFFMNKFRKLGFIDYNGKISVNNSLMTVVLADAPEHKQLTKSDKKTAAVAAVTPRRKSAGGGGDKPKRARRQP